MPAKKTASKTKAKATRRTSVSFPTPLFETLEQIAEQQKVSVAWVIRDATDKYISDRWPLLERKG